MNGEVEQVLIVRKVRSATIYKLLLFGLLISMIPLGIVFGITGFFGADTVKWNNQPVHGTAALFVGPAISAFLALLFTGFLGTLTCLGLWILSQIRPISIRFVAQSSAPVAAQPGVQYDRP